MEIKVDFPPPVSGPTFKSLRTGEAFIHQDTFASSGKVFMKVVPIVGQGPEDGYQQLCLNTGECFGPPPETNKVIPVKINLKGEINFNIQDQTKQYFPLAELQRGDCIRCYHPLAYAFAYSASSVYLVATEYGKPLDIATCVINLMTGMIIPHNQIDFRGIVEKILNPVMTAY